MQSDSFDVPFKAVVKFWPHRIILFGLDRVDKYQVDIYCSFLSQYSTNQLSSFLLKQ